VRGFYALITDITERKRAERNQEFLSALMAQVSLLSEPDEILRVASAALGSYLDAYRCYFTEIDTGTNQAIVLPAWRRPAAPSLVGSYSLASPLTPGLLTLLQDGQSIAIADVIADPRTADFAETYAQIEVRSYVATPYIQAGRLVGLLVVQCAEPRPWLADEVALVTSTMERVWPVIERARGIVALRQSEERYRALIENAGEAIFVANQEGIYVEVNPSACALLGYHQEELLGKTITDLLPPADHERLSTVRELLSSGEPHIDEWEMLHKDGSRVPVEISAKILPDGRWQTFVRDITERKRAEQTLRFLADASVALASSLDYQTTLDTVARLAVPQIADWCVIDQLTDDGQIEGVALAHVDPEKVAWAHELRKQYPIDPNAPAGAPQVIRSGQAELYPSIPDELLQQAAKNEEELRLLRSVGYRSVMIVPLAARGRTFGAITFVATESRINFTESDLAMAQEVARRAAVAVDNALLFRAVQQSEQQLRASEERYQRQLAELELIYATAPVGLAVLDTDLRYVRANETLARIKGISVAAHLGKTGRELLPSVAMQLDEKLHQVLATGEPVVDLEIRVEPPAFPGQERIWMESLYPLHSPTGQVIAINAVVQDITERKRQEAELKALNETLELRVAERTAELERSNRELDQFAYVASHDLKAPLRAIAQLASWAIEDATGQVPPAAQEHLGKLQSRVRRMSMLLDDLLTYSRAGRLHHAPEPVDIAALVHDVVETLAPPPGFQVVIEDKMPLINTERVPLEMVLRNLIGNAIKHHHRADGQVVVGVRSEPDRLTFTVVDNGPGIDPQYHARIFDLFQTLQPRDRVEGSGMGLAIVKRIIENRGGTIQVESTVGRGAAFRFTWPLDGDEQPRSVMS
jgi:PAS domain S-box-containing protein